MCALRIPLFLAILSATGLAPLSGALAAPALEVDARALAQDDVEETTPALAQAIRKQAGGALKGFYAERGYRPLWIANGRVGPTATALLDQLATADLDDLKPSSYGVSGLREAIAKARSGEPQALARAEVKLSAAFARYVRDLRKPVDVGMIYADPALTPKALKPEAVLRAAAFPRDFGAYIRNMGWMSQHYVRLRVLAGRAREQGVSDAELDRLHRNLDRARILPGPWVRHVVVDASSGRLWYYEAGREVGMMKVVVGTHETQTPMLAGQLQWAILNPYWNVPTYLAKNNVAPKVIAGRSLASLNMEALSDWSPSARKLRPGEIDWPAVASGASELRIRELPGPHNSMGKVKFLFPNDEGIYLHDTPARDLLKEDDRHFSNGCIRLEKADELGRWLMHAPLKPAGKAPEQAVVLPVPVPVYLTYLTATATESGLAFRNDVYGRDE